MNKNDLTNSEHEIRFLATLIENNELLEKTYITSKHIFYQEHKEVLKTIKKLIKDGKQADIITLGSCGIKPSLLQQLSEYGNVKLFDSVQQQLLELYKKRTTLKALEQARQKINSGENFEDAANILAREIMAIPTMTQEKQVFSANDYVKKGLGQDKGFIVDGLVVENSMGFIISPPKVGKTNFAYKLALHMAMGRDFIGHATLKPSNVLYVLLEGTFKNLTTSYGYTDNIFLWEDKNFNWEEDRKQLIKFVKENNINVVFIDSLYRMTDKDISKSVFLKPILQDLDNLATELKVTFLICHHTNRLENTENYQNKVAGSADIIRAGEFFMYLEKQPLTEEEEEQIYYMSNEEINRLPIKMILKKEDYRFGNVGFRKFNVEIDTYNNVMKYEKFKLEVKRVATETRLSDLINYAEVIIKDLPVLNKSMLTDALSKEYGMSKITIQKTYIQDIWNHLENNNIIVRDKGYNYRLVTQAIL